MKILTLKWKANKINVYIEKDDVIAKKKRVQDRRESKGRKGKKKPMIKLQIDGRDDC